MARYPCARILHIGPALSLFLLGGYTFSVCTKTPNLFTFNFLTWTSGHAHTRTERKLRVCRSDFLQLKMKGLDPHYVHERCNPAYQLCPNAELSRVTI